MFALAIVDRGGWVAKNSALANWVPSNLSGTATLTTRVWDGNRWKVILIGGMGVAGFLGVCWWWWQPQWSPNGFLKTIWVCVCSWGSRRALITPHKASKTLCGVLGGHCSSLLCRLPCWQRCKLPRKGHSRWLAMPVVGIEVLLFGLRGLLLVRRGSVTMVNFCLSPIRIQSLLFSFGCVWFLSSSDCRLGNILWQHRSSRDGRAQVFGGFRVRLAM